MEALITMLREVRDPRESIDRVHGDDGAHSSVSRRRNPSAPPTRPCGANGLAGASALSSRSARRNGAGAEAEVGNGLWDRLKLWST